MNKIRFKQRRLFKLMKALIIFGAVFIFFYIGAKPIISEYNATLATIINYVCDAVVIAILVILFCYYSKYGKVDSFLSHIEDEINDYGYYISSREERESTAYLDAMAEDMSSCGYAVSRNTELFDFNFSIRAKKGKTLFYAVDASQLDKNDIVAYLDCVIQDITSLNVMRKGNIVLCFVTDEASDDAIALSKMITPLDKKELIKIALCICEVPDGNVYFLGNVQTKCQQMIANFVMNCDVPIKDKFIHKEKLAFQSELEEKMQSFTIKDYTDGNFSAH